MVLVKARLAQSLTRRWRAGSSSQDKPLDKLSFYSYTAFLIRNSDLRTEEPVAPRQMLTHSDIWNAVDRLAAKAGLTASGLAKAAGLDPTTFNKSKRVTPEGRPRWPSTESVAKSLQATNTTVDTFVSLITDRGGASTQAVPLIGLAEAGSGGYFDDAGFPVGKGWDEIAFPAVNDEHAYALEISGSSMEPAYRDGTIVMVSPTSPVRRGDRVVVKTRNGEVMAKELKRRTSKTVELRSLNPDHKERTLSVDDVVWIARIMWASQ
jgi:phage repressor protein C with HTH and peptisase S24 domain